ncbi:MFS transporter [Nocardioides sp. NPDC057772]|uniref:MFS transporter n=1 Tax=Nocardioides sp. NPDC057772 TaxID=3346245 RepID=UPI0036725B93
MTSDPQTDPGVRNDGERSGWASLAHRDTIGIVTVLAGGVALYAMNLYFTAALMPSVVEAIGGRRYYAWAATGYLIVAVVATMLVSRSLDRFGARRSYVVAFALFGVGTLVSSLSPSMLVFVGGRALQGAGAGLLIGLGFAVIRSTLPPGAWSHAASLVSAMFAVGALLGPALGGTFAEVGAWRGAFAVLAGVSVLLGVLAGRVLVDQPTPAGAVQQPLPVAPIGCLGVAAGLLSLSVTTSGPAAVALVASGLAAIVAFLIVDARAVAGVLPRLAYARGSRLKWVYLTVAALSAGVMTENFVPLFGQQLASLTPLWAGFLGAVLSVGWTVAQMVSAGTSEAAVRQLIRISPWVVTASLVAYGLTQQQDATTATVLLWAALLFLAGVGIGIAFPHLSVAAMRSAPDGAEGAKAAAAISTTQLIAYTLSSALAGNLLAAGEDEVSAARLVVLGLAACVAVGIVTATRDGRPAQAD